jgi:hypothetical protein
MVALKSLTEEPQPPGTSFKDGSTCWLLGYYTPGDGGGAFRYDPALETEDDGGVIIRPASPIEGRWVRMDLRQIWAEYFGCTLSAPDDAARTTAINKATNYCREAGVVNLHIWTGTYGFDNTGLESERIKKGLIQAGKIRIVGEGYLHTVLKCNSLLGFGIHFVSQPFVEPTDYGECGLRDITLQGNRLYPDEEDKAQKLRRPNHECGTGVYVGSSHRYENVQVIYFDFGMEWDSNGGHITLMRGKVHNNHYGNYFRNETANGDFFICDSSVEGNFSLFGKFSLAL